MAFDPNVPKDVQSLKTNRGTVGPTPSFGDRLKAAAARGDYSGMGAIPLQGQTPWSSADHAMAVAHAQAAGLPASRVPNPLQPSGQDDPTPPPPAPRPAVDPSGLFSPNAQEANAARAQAGVLPAGFIRYQGDVGYPVYEGRQTDGTRVFTDNPDRVVASLRARPATSFEGTQVGPNQPRITDSGWIEQPGVAAFEAPATAPLDTSFGASASPRERLRYAQNSLRVDPSDLINSAGNSPEAAAQAVEMLQKRMGSDPNADNPEVAMANRAALAQLNGNVDDVRRRFYGGYQNVLGMAAAGAGGKGTLGLRDILANRYRQAALGQRVQHDQAMEGIAAANSDRAAAAEDRQARDSMLRNFQTALKTDPNAAATIVQQNAPPPNMSRADFNKWMASDKGMAWQQMFQSVLDQGAANSMWQGWPNLLTLGLGDRLDKKALESGQVGLHRIAFDKSGRFAGMTDADGGTAYPLNATLGGSNYNMSAINSVSPQYLKWLQESAAQRTTVPKD